METTTFDDCQHELLVDVTEYGRTQYDQWTRRAGYAQVVNFVKSFTHQYLFDLSSSDVREAISASHHALGDVKSTEQLAIVENFTTPFAFQHLFHWYIETKRKVPTWKEFRDWMVIGEAAPKWYEPLKAHLERSGGSFTRKQWSRAAKWRLGKVYMSNIRELDLLVKLREAGLPVRYHLLADVLLRVDFWCKNILVCVYFPNPTYRNGESGRKAPASRFFDSVQGHFHIIHFGIERQGFGNIWLATEQSVTRLVAKIQEELTNSNLPL